MSTNTSGIHPVDGADGVCPSLPIVQPTPAEMTRAREAQARERATALEHMPDGPARERLQRLFDDEDA